MGRRSPTDKRRDRHITAGDDASSGSCTTDRRNRLRTIAMETLSVIEDGHYTADGVQYDLEASTNETVWRTAFYSPDCHLKYWCFPYTYRPTYDERIRIAVRPITTS